jgi:hypothetical protein
MMQLQQDEVLKLAKQAQVHEELCGEHFIYEFARLVAAAAASKEREACADLCATWYDPMWPEHDQAGSELAKAIQARGEAT